MAPLREAWRSPATRPRIFRKSLARLWWKLDKALTPEDVRYSALVCLVDAIKHGTTLLIDHHASPNAIDGSLDVIGEAVQAAGLRACLCYEVTDRDGPERAQAGIFGERAVYPEAARQTRDPLLAATFGLHASLTLSDETLGRLPGGARRRVSRARGRARGRRIRQLKKERHAGGGPAGRGMEFWDRKPWRRTASTLTRARPSGCARPAPG